MIHNAIKTRKSRGFFARVWLAAMVGLLAAGCYIPGLGALPEADDPPEPGAPGGVEDTLLGKFVIYQVNSGSVKTVTGQPIPHYITEVPLNPSANPDVRNWNAEQRGIFDTVTLHYRDPGDGSNREGSARPDAMVMDVFDPALNRKVRKLSFFFTDSPIDYNQIDIPEGDNCFGDPGNNIGSAHQLLFNGILRPIFNGPGDMDWFYFDSPSPNAMIHARVRFTSLRQGNNLSIERHRPVLRLYDTDGTTVLFESRYGNDFVQWTDPDLSYILPAAGRYYFTVHDEWDKPCTNNSKTDGYWIILETPSVPYGNPGNVIGKATIQPARSGNPELNGGPTYEPDDLSTQVRDLLPDCDGIPGTGDEGDAGISEDCNAAKVLGKNDGNLQFQEVDNKSAVDDGEYFSAVPTDVPSIRDSEASVIRTPDRNTLTMFVSYGNMIFMLESLPGGTEPGVNWDLTNLLTGRPSILPRESRNFGGDPEAPVLSSGWYGFCDTYPEGDDIFAADTFDGAVSWGGTTPTADGVRINIPRAFPNTPAVTQGDNGHLDSRPLEDDLLMDGATPVITSGKDGIINTYFAPRYVAYGPKAANGKNPVVFPSKPADIPNKSGPGVPDNPRLFYATLDDYDYPLAGLGGDNNRGYLLGDDDTWNTALFGSTTPPVYFQNRKCNFYSMSYNFDQCALGAPIDPSTGEEPISVVSGGNRKLDTVQSVLKGDDYLCHAASGATVTAAICAGPNGKFDWDDIYFPIKGDDELTLVVDTGFTGDTIVGVSSGPDGILQTSVMTDFFYLDFEGNRAYAGGFVAALGATVPGGDYLCQDLKGDPAICPDIMETEADLFYSSPLPTFPAHRKLHSVWPMYFSSPTVSKGKLNNVEILFNPHKFDLTGPYDDEFCKVDGQLAICPGPNGHFESYPLTKRTIIDQDEDLFNLYDRVKDLVAKDCYSLVGEKNQEDWASENEQRYVLYKYTGVRMDDRVMWSPGSGYFLTTGPNGIHQSCVAGADKNRIGFNQGLPDVPIILPGADNALQTYPLKDQKDKYDRGVYKILSGEDGVSNSYAMGDDLIELWMGMGQPDQPCVLAGPDGEADTDAQGNDTQLYTPGEVTGFDAFAAFGPKAIVVEDQIRLYYSGLGWLVAPYLMRPGAGDLNGIGECKRPGLDKIYGEYKLDLSESENSEEYSYFKNNFQLHQNQVQMVMDNNESVAIAPRIGLAVSTMSKLRLDPGDWKFFNKPVLDIGEQCASSLDFPIALDIDLPGLMPDINLGGAFSPEIQVTDAPTGEDDMFLMFFSGVLWAQDAGIVSPDIYSTIGVARSLDGINWTPIRDLSPLISMPTFDLGAVLGGGGGYNYTAPSIVGGGEDDFGNPMYTMFMDQFEDLWASSDEIANHWDMKNGQWISAAFRKGKTSFACTVAPKMIQLNAQEKARRLAQAAVLLFPIGIVIALRAARRKRQG